MNKVNEKIVYDDMSDVPVEDAMTLEEHDFRYHNGHYKQGDDCLFRDRLAEGDKSDDALNEANSIEAAAYYAKLNEMYAICDKFCENLPFMTNARRRKKNGIELRSTPQSKNGDRWFMIMAPKDFDASQADPEVVKDVCSQLGYTFKQMKVGISNGKKMIAIQMNNPHLVGAYNKGTHHGTRELKVFGEEEPSRPVSESRKNEILKQFGYKVKDGKVAKRGKADSDAEKEAESAAKKYLRLVESGGTALKNRTNAEIKKDRDEEAESKWKETENFLKEMGL